MKRSNPLLILWSAAGISLLSGFLLTIHSVNGLRRTMEILSKKADDSAELARIRLQANRHRILLDTFAQYPAIPLRFEALVRDTLPGQPMATLGTDTSPAVQGWISRKISVEFNDIGGADLGRLLEAGSSAKPPWTLRECTLFAAPTPGRIAKATLVMGTVERP